MARVRCESCAKKSQRACPGLNGQICSKCCGEKRGSAIACPPECPYLPWGYDNAQRLTELIIEASSIVVNEACSRRPELDRELPESWQSLLPRPPRDWEAFQQIVEMQSIIVASSVFPEADGKTVVQTLVDSGLPTCTNDLRIVMQCLSTMQPVLLEFVDSASEDRHHFRDLLDPNEALLTVQVPEMEVYPDDGGMWVFGWTLTTPHFRRSFWTWTIVPDELQAPFRQFLIEKVGGEWQSDAIRAFLRERLREAADFATAIGESIDGDADGIDEEAAYWIGTYKLCAKRSAVRKALDSSKQLLLVEDEDEFVRYLWQEEASEEAEARGVVVLLTAELELTALSEDADQFRSFIEALLGNLVAFKTDRYLGPEDDPFTDTLDGSDDEFWDEP